MLLSVSEVAKRLKVNRNYVYKLIHSGLLPYIELGSMKVREDALKEFLANMEGKNVDEEMQNNFNKLPRQLSELF